MENKRKYQILDGTILKIIAMVSMVFDHVGAVFFPEQTWMRMIGRLAMPIFSFCIVEGYSHTRDQNKYMLRLGLLALLSELPFDLAFSGAVDLGHQNIMLSFLISILALRMFDWLRGDPDPVTGQYRAGKTALGLLAVAVMAVLALILKADYTLFAVIAVFLFYVLRQNHPLLRTGMGVGFLALTRTVGYYCTTGFSLIPLLLYNGKKGRGLKWLFYVFYPGHLLILYLLRLLVRRG